MYRIESLLSGRLFLTPQLVGDRIYFLSNLSGRLSLYVMDHGGSVPEPLLPPPDRSAKPRADRAATSSTSSRGLGNILVMLDHDGDENYQPMLIPLDGGLPEPAFGGALANYRVPLPCRCDADRNLALLRRRVAHRADVHRLPGRPRLRRLAQLGQSVWGAYFTGRQRRSHARAAQRRLHRGRHDALRVAGRGGRACACSTARRWTRAPPARTCRSTPLQRLLHPRRPRPAAHHVALRGQLWPRLPAAGRPASIRPGAPSPARSTPAWAN